MFCSKCGAATHAGDTHVPGQVGQVLDEKWRLERKIGEGGMGTVYLAHDLVLDRKVAIKLLARSLAHDADLVGRFEREAKLTAGLEHPNIVAVYSVGRTENRPFMVMKYLEGTALSAHLRARGTVARDELLSLVRQVCAGLDFIHARGFIHRDIKTGNIFVGPTGLATILDFGILRPSRNAEAITRTGMVMGTPQYMSPEQALGIRDIDHRADLYALAVVIYECLTGALPFEADNDLKLVQMQAHAPPPEVRQRAPWLPDGLSAVMMRALAKLPEQRFASASDLYLALEAAFGVRYLTGPGGIPLLEQTPPRAANTFPSVPGLVAYPIPLQASPPADFPIPLEPTPPAPGEQRASPVEDEPLVGTLTRPSRPTGRVPGPAASRPESRRWPLLAAGVVAAGVLGGGAWWLLASGGDPVVVAAPVPAPGPVAAVVVPEPPVPEPDPLLPSEGGEAAADTGEEPAGEELAGDERIAEPLIAVPQVELAALNGSRPSPTPVRRPPAKSGVGKVNVITTFKGGSYWASILVNGQRRGTTPALLELPAGRHKLRLERTGFRPVERQIKVASGGSAVVRIELIP